MGLAVAINGLGGTPLMELLIIAREVIRILEEKEKLQVHITMCGNFVTSIEVRLSVTTESIY